MAKINLSLSVLGRRLDGYHLLHSLVVFADVGDTLSFVPGPQSNLTIGGPFGTQLQGDADNLVFAAADAFLSAFPESTSGSFVLDKQLPVASGIGGGSADAAATLRALMRVNGIHSAGDLKTVEALALTLGADVPVCLRSESAVMTGIGEDVQPVKLPHNLPALLVNPGVGVPTGPVFSALGLDCGDERKEPIVCEDLLDFDDLLSYLYSVPNDLEEASLALAPEIGEVLSMVAGLDGCLLSRMSGSGATVFGLFSSRELALQGCQMIEKAQPGWWVQDTALNPRPRSSE